MVIEDYGGDVEVQRARMQEALRTCKTAILISINDKGQCGIAYLHCNPVTIMGMRDLLNIMTAPQILLGGNDSD